MQDVPDAPWIRDAELNGMPDSGQDPVCPICGRECETIYMDKDKDVFGCDVCIRTQDIWEWAEEQKGE